MCIASLPYDRYDGPEAFDFFLSVGCRMADRCYCPDPPVEGRLVLEGDEARHLSRVRRVGVGEVVEVFDGRGFATRARVEGAGKNRVDLTVLGGPIADRMAPCRLTLATAVPKGERFDWLVEKATELGVARLVPLITERSVVDPRLAKLDRLRRLIVEAAKQCGRNRLMELDTPTPWTALAHAENDETRLLAHPGGVPSSAWRPIRSGAAVTLAVGPEGGFSEPEVALAVDLGWQAIGLGETLLRIETAGLAGSAAILALCGSSER
jgi:16S rRNA (uracil1498-N3)-methyltransferase